MPHNFSFYCIVSMSLTRLASVRMNAEMFQQMSQFCVDLYFCCFLILCALNRTLVLPGEKNKFCVCASVFTNMVQGSFDLTECTSYLQHTRSSVAAVDIHSMPKPGFKIPNSWNRTYYVCQCISMPFNYCKKTSFCCCFQTEHDIC